MGTNARIYDGKNAITGFLSVFTYFVAIRMYNYGFRVRVSAFSLAVYKPPAFRYQQNSCDGLT